MTKHNVVRFEPIEYDEERAQFVGTTDFLLQTRPYVLGESVRLFPEPEDVFADDVARHAEHLDPLVSIDLSSVSPELTGWVHLVLPKEIDLVGEYTEPFHNEFVSTNWISFSVIDGRYRFLGDFRYFMSEDDPRLEVTPPHLDEWEAARPVQRASYDERKQRYQKTGWDSFRSKRPHPDTNDGPVHQFKEHAWQSNWQMAPRPPSAFLITPSGGVSTADGRDLVFVASVEARKYRDDSQSGPDEALLFVDPVESIAVQTFDWT